jgi:hypothetical protein
MGEERALALTDGDPVPPEVELWRRIPDQWVHFDPSGTRPMSQAFRDGITGDLSVHIAELTNVDQVLAAYPGVQIAGFSSQLPLSLNYEVLYRPTAADPSHAIIRPKLTTGDSRKVARASFWVVGP